MSGLGLIFLRRGGQAHPTAGSDHIKFADQAVFDILMANGVSSDGVGITREDAEKVTTIGTWFNGKTNISTFNEFRFFTGVTSLGAPRNSPYDAAFYNSSLAEITLPESMRVIGYNAFRGCTSLTTVDGMEVVEEILENAFYATTQVTFDTLYLRSIKRLLINALDGAYVRELIIGNSITTLPNASQNSATWGRKAALKSISFPGSIAAIPQYTLFTYTALENVTFGEGIQSIGTNAVRGCSSLPRFELPSTITSIADGAFAYCDKIQYGIIRAVTPPTLVNVNAFVQNGGKTYPIYVPDESVAAYQSADVWSGIASRIKPLSELNG